MNTAIQSKEDRILKFLGRVENLFSEIKQWIVNTDLIVSSAKITIEEEALGSYNSSKLVIKGFVILHTD